MGAIVPYDICSVCGYKRQAKESHCNCIKYRRGEIDKKTGKQIYMINPVFFFRDLSFVYRVPADKSAWALAKVASKKGEVEYMSQEIDKEPKLEENEVIINKLIKISSHEPTISIDSLNKIANENPYDVFGTATANGIIFKPEEYIYMRKVGMSPFRSSFIRAGSLNSDISSILNPYIIKRNSNSICLKDRVISEIVNKNTKKNNNKNKIASESNIIRVAPDYIVYRDTLNEAISEAKKGSKFIKNASLLLPIAGAFAPYAYAANVRRKSAEGYPVGLFERTAMTYPLPMSIFLGTALAALGKRFKKADDNDIFSLLNELDI